MAGRKSIASQFSEDSSRYHYEVPDWQLHPDPKNRTCLLLNWVGRDKRVLELGCSTGYMSKYLVQNQNCSVIGIELDRAAAQQAAKFCREVHVRNLNNADRFAGLDQQSFDVVLMGDVLEHLTDPRGVLIQIRKFLDHNARIVVCLPNVLHWLTRIKMLLGHFDYEPSGTLDHTHLRFFTVKTSSTANRKRRVPGDQVSPSFRWTLLWPRPSGLAIAGRLVSRPIRLSIAV